MRFLIVGGTGVLSTAITQEALSQGIDIWMINRGNRMNLIPKQVHLLKADVHNTKIIKELLDGLHFDAVMDCICYTKQEIANSFKLFEKYVDQYIFISSCAVYDTRKGEICYEDSPKKLPIWKYSIDKVDCEDYLSKISKSSKVHCTIIRPCVTYGGTRIPYGISPTYGYHWTLVERILHEKPIITWNGAKNRCNISRVEDFAVGVIGLIGNEKAYNQAFNICGEDTPSWQDVLNVLSELIGKKVTTFDIDSAFYAKELPNRAGEILGGRSIDAINSNEKIKSIVPSFKQNISLKDGIKMTIDYYKANNYIYGIDYAFDGETDRIINDYAKKNNLNISELNLGFVDYFGNAKTSEHYRYFINRYGNNLLIKIISKGIRFIHRVIRKMKKIF